jgi:hypothetical protein
MKLNTLIKLIFSSAFVCLLTISAQAQASGTGISSYTAIDYDEATNTVMAYTEADGDYQLLGDYQLYVRLTVTNDSGVIVANGINFAGGDGVVTLELDFAGEANRTYTAVGKYYVDASFEDYDYYPPYQTFYYDNWYFTYFEGQGIYQPWSYFFSSPGYTVYHRRTSQIYLGRTYDSASTTVVATTCLLTFNKYYNRGVDAGGPQGQVNMVDSVSRVWSAIKSSTDANVIIPDEQVKDGKNNVYQKYPESSSGTFRTMAIFSCVNTGKKSSLKECKPIL